jgi:SAM-dependent methyltransferase
MRAADAAWYETSSLYLNAKALHLGLGWHHRRFLDLAGPGRGRDLFDIGCGTGDFLAQARDHGFQPAGIDFDRADIELARRRHGLADVGALSLGEHARRFPERRFDVVTLFEVIEHVADPPAFLAMARHRLRPGGLLGLSTPNRCRGVDPLGDGDLPPNHLTRWTSAALERLVRGAGLEIERLEVKPLLLEDMVGALRRRLHLGLARRLLEQSVETGDARLAAGAQVLMRAKDLSFAALAISPWAAARLLGRPGVGLLCIARWPG